MKQLLIIFAAIFLFPSIGFSAEIIAVPDIDDTDCLDGKCYLQNALDFAWGLSLTEDTLIKVARGNYQAESTLFYLSMDSEYSVHIEGGYDEDGQNRILDPDNTIILGKISSVQEEARGCLSISSNDGGAVTVEGITFKDSNMHGLDVEMNIFDSDRNGSVTIKNNKFNNITGTIGYAITVQQFIGENGNVSPGELKFTDNQIDACGVVSISTHTLLEENNPGPITVQNNKLINSQSIGLSVYGESIHIEGNTVSDCQSTGIKVISGKNLKIERNKILNNTAVGDGGGLFINYTPDDFTGIFITNNIIAGNTTSGNGGGIYLNIPPYVNYHGMCYIQNNTITGNKSLSTTTPNHGLSCEYLAFDEVAIVSNIIWGNTDTENPGYDIYLGALNEYVYLFNNDFSTLYETESSQKSENIDEDPEFVSPVGNDYHLTSNSPCIDSGSSISGADIDFENDERPYDGDADGEAVIDIGADEYIAWPLIFSQGLGSTDCSDQGVCEGDLDGDNDIDGSDLAIVVSRMNQSNG